MMISELVHKLQCGEIQLTGHINETLAYIDEKESLLQALVPEPGRHQRLLREANELANRFTDEHNRPSLYGILIGVKDLYNVDGLPTRAGSKLPEKEFMGPEASFVSRLKSLGALILGKTISTEFAYFAPGPTRNPVNPDHTPGGSSSGSAAAVAAGYCLLALGTQTIGSVIRPASFCGVYGFKPSYGLIPLDGVFPFSESADHAGWFCQSLDDLFYVANSILPEHQASLEPSKPKIAIVKGEFLQQADDKVRQNFTEVIELLEENGFICKEYDFFPDIDKINAIHKNLIAVEFYQNHRTLNAKYHSLYSPQSIELFNTGKSIDPEELPLLQEYRMILRSRIENAMQELEVQLILSPSTITTALKGLSVTGSPLMSLPFTNAGMPLLTIPCGKNDLGLPFGLQLSAAFGEDIALLQHSLDIDALLK
jgi:Asp-tRNA(Asn)/Glu-tRNA(Gln) amidotransferase A subunit family amidase